MEQTSTKQVALKWGVILGLAYCLFTVAGHFMGMAGNQKFGMLSLVILGAVLFLGIKEFKEDNDNLMTFGQGFGTGALISLIGSLISGIFVYVYTGMISPGYIDDIMETSRIAMEEQGYSEAQIQQGLEISAGFMSPGSMAIMSVVMGVISGIIISLIISAILQKKPPQSAF